MLIAIFSWSNSRFYFFYFEPFGDLFPIFSSFFTLLASFFVHFSYSYGSGHNYPWGSVQIIRDSLQELLCVWVSASPLYLATPAPNQRFIPQKVRSTTYLDLLISLLKSFFHFVNGLFLYALRCILFFIPFDFNVHRFWEPCNPCPRILLFQKIWVNLLDERF